VAVVDGTPQANVTHSYQYDEFGMLLDEQEANANLYKYVGRYGVMHEADDLYYMRARYYDAEIGRFLSEDPIWHTNLYPYADNNPLVHVDPNGEVATNIMDVYKIMDNARTGYGYMKSSQNLQNASTTEEGLRVIVQKGGEVAVRTTVDKLSIGITKVPVINEITDAAISKAVPAAMNTGEVIGNAMYDFNSWWMTKSGLADRLRKRAEGSKLQRRLRAICNGSCDSR